jgi:type VI secretion system protein ImpK
MTDAFANLVAPIVRHVVDLLHDLESGEAPSPLPAVRDRLLRLLGEADQKATTAAALTHDYALAKYALVYWIDEVLTNSSWGQEQVWSKHILEFDLFRERERATRFYERAREAEALAGTDPLEVFFLCGVLGFRGKHVHDSTAFRAWAERAYNRIVAGRNQPDRFLPEEVRDAEQKPLAPLPGKSILLATSVLVSVTALVTLACFLLAVHLAV